MDPLLLVTDEVTPGKVITSVLTAAATPLPESLPATTDENSALKNQPISTQKLIKSFPTELPNVAISGKSLNSLVNHVPLQPSQLVKSFTNQSLLFQQLTHVAMSTSVNALQNFATHSMILFAPMAQTQNSFKVIAA
jgi:hypothetical protein